MTSIEIEDIYPLSPAQQGLLFHSLYAPGAGTYFTQFVCTLQGEVDVAALERAWQEVAARHPALRASFVWEDVQEPLQVVHHRELRIPFALHDLAEMPTDELDGWIDNFLREDRNRGFNLSKAPLMRLTLLRTQDAAYQLIWSHHHLLLDGWSVSLILGEVFAFYAAILNGQEPPPAQPRPHRDYIEWLQRQDLSKAETFWRQELHGFSMPTPLVVGPAQNGHAPVEHDYAEQHILLSAEETASLQSLARQHGLTMTTIMQGAWALLLSRYSGLEDVLFGTVASGRSVDLPEIESIAGMLINTLPLRVRTPSSMHALPWLKALQERQTEARRYEYTPLARAHEWSMVPRDLSLFESVLTFENYPAPVWLRQGGNGGLGLSDIRMLEQSHYPLVVQAIPIPELLVKVVYDSSRFEAASIIRMLGHLQTLLAGIAADPMLPLGDYSLLTATEREQLLVEWNYNGDEPVAPVCLHRQFELQVEKSPQAVAMLFEGEQFTYAELNRRANRVAHRLQELGVEPDVPVGLYVERSPEMVIGLLGILKAGGAYVPLDPAYPRERLAFMLEDARVPILLAQRHLVERLPQHTAQVICLDDGWAAGGQANDSNLTCEVAPDNLAYIIYTSGSTGTPKGALVTHANVARLFTATRRWFNFGPGDVWTLFHSYTFDFSVWELWGALLYGGRLVVVPDRVRRSPETFYNLLCDEGVTVLNQTPSAFRQLMWAEEASRVRADLALRLVIFGGEALEVGSLQPWFERHGDTSPQLANMYGITETTVHVTYHPLTRADTRHGPGSVIGRPIPDLQTYVLDMRMQPVPVGVPGEIYVGGAGLARGYLRRPELTAERFVPNPFVSTEYRVPSAEGRGASAFHTPHSGGERLYKTGDLARYLPGGELEYLGRSDRQVKIRGFRIELGELEAALSRHPAVRQAVAIAREDVPGEKQLVAYIVAEQDSLSISDLRRFLQAHLPDYMVPAAFVTLDALPITHNGKIDYRALPPPEQSRPDIQSGYTAPRTPEEKLLAEIWGQVLRVEGVGVDDNFFELGGDSILSIQIVARANQEGLKLTPRQLFERPTIAQLAQVVSNSPAAHAQDEQVEGPVRFTPIQLRFFGQDLPQPQHYNQAVFLEVLQELDPALLEKAIRYLPVHHDALRLRFSQEASGWQQFCAGWDAAISSASFVQFDLSGLPHDVQGAAIEQKGLELHRSLDLANGPLMAAAHFNLGPGKPARLLIVVHHLAVDAVSWPILLVDLQSAYEQLSRGESIRLPSKTTSFQEWAERLVAHARSGAVEQELDYWLARRGTQVAPLPLDYPDGLAANNELSAQEVTVAFDDDETSTLLHDIARDYRAQVNEVLLAALAQVIARWAGGEQALIDLEGHGREDLFDDVDLSRTVGWFTTIFPALIPAREGADPRRALNMVKEYLRGIPNRGIGYGLLRYLSANPAISAELGSLPQAQVSFNYLGRLDNGLADSTMFDWAHGSTGPIHSPEGMRPYLLDVNAKIADGQLHVGWTYSENLHSRSTVERLAQNFLQAVRSLITHWRSIRDAHYIPSDFPLAELSKQELDRINASYGQVEDIYPLTPAQQGILFHALYAPGSTVYFTQFSWDFYGTLNVSAFMHAWQRVVARHAVLRTAFAWEGLSEPLQVVCANAKLPWEELDWREFSPAEQQALLEAYLKSDRQRGFDLRSAPLMRNALIRMSDGAYHFVWSQHHILLDGWCVGLLLKELFIHYGALCRGEDTPGHHLEKTRPYRDYVAWLQEQDLAKAETFWRKTLSGFTAPTRLGPGRSTGADDAEDEESYTTQELQLSTELTGALQTFAREHGLTLNTIVQGAWALLLSHFTGQQDVVFGSTVSGRPVDLPGVEAMLGLFINTLPVRVLLSPEGRLLPWLKELQSGQAEMRQYEYTPLTQVRRWSAVPAGQPLFESVVVFENLPMSGPVLEPHEGLSVHNIRSFIRNNFPLTLRVVPGQTLSLHILYDGNRFDPMTIHCLLEKTQTLLAGIIAQPAADLRDMSAALDRLDRTYRLAEEAQSASIGLRKLRAAQRRNISKGQLEV